MTKALESLSSLTPLLKTLCATSSRTIGLKVLQESAVRAISLAFTKCSTTLLFGILKVDDL